MLPRMSNFKLWGLCMRARIIGWIFIVSYCFPMALVAQDSGGMIFAAAKTSKFVNLSGLPTCLKVAVQRGDPSKGSAALMLKFAPGCTVPWHWHTAGEQHGLGRGEGTAGKKDGKPGRGAPGGHGYFPARNVSP